MNTASFARRVLPDMEICRAKSIGASSFVECLVEFQVQCPHLLSTGYGYYCKHPQRALIAKHTLEVGSVNNFPARPPLPGRSEPAREYASAMDDGEEPCANRTESG